MATPVMATNAIQVKRSLKIDGLTLRSASRSRRYSVAPGLDQPLRLPKQIVKTKRQRGVHDAEELDQPLAPGREVVAPESEPAQEVRRQAAVAGGGDVERLEQDSPGAQEEADISER